MMDEETFQTFVDKQIHSPAISRNIMLSHIELAHRTSPLHPLLHWDSKLIRKVADNTFGHLTKLVLKCHQKYGLFIEL